MTVNPFWFGYFLGMLTVVFILLVIGFIAARNHEDEQPEIKEIDLPEELQKAIAEEIMKYERGDKHDGV